MDRTPPRHHGLRTACLAAGVALLLTLSIGASAGADSNGATVVRNPYGPSAICLALDGAGDFWVFTCRIQQVIQPSGAVSEYLKGSFDPAFADLNSPAPAHAVTDVTTAQTRLYCDSVNGRLTAVVAGAVTPSGEVNLTCKSG